MDPETVYPHLIWRGDNPNVWKRGVDEMEQFWGGMTRVYDSGDLRPNECTCHLILTTDIGSLGSPDSAQAAVDTALRNAWITARHNHPAIASHLTFSFEDRTFSRVYRTISSQADKDEWLQETLIYISNGKTGDEYANTHISVRKFPTLFIITPPQATETVHGQTRLRRDLVFRAPHDTIDGHGIFNFLNNYLNIATEALRQGKAYTLPNFNGAEVINLTPPYRIAAAVPPAPTPEQLKRIQKMAMEQALKDKENPLSALHVPSKEGIDRPARAHRCVVRLPSTTSSRFVAACKAKGVSVTQALHAAIPVVMRDRLEPALEHRRLLYTEHLVINTRPNCLEPYNGPNHPVAIYHATSVQALRVEIDSIPPGTDGESRKQEFFYILEQVRNFYESYRKNPEFAALTPIVNSLFVAQMPKLEPSPPPGPPPTAIAKVSLSSLGRIDSVLPPQIGSFEVDKVWATADKAFNGYAIYAHTHRGQMHITLTYNEAWHSEDDASGFLHNFKDVLIRYFDLED